MQIIGKYECKQFSYRNYFSEDISIIKNKWNLQVNWRMSDQDKK